eukprot:CAMPEP_0170172910 /NCGR_PEP_ID=MMETSP0040_2-20121228/6164_1 /TAXON_ID=641309 /ORGANISM="Lotharella oceanica, Strain CCMP622" /LENGTH=169 /DNA_ID=CAMNT_0010413805 /DNA_START=694 /DNA_END=1203 /DNA_ORIENTATION=+
MGPGSFLYADRYFIGIVLGMISLDLSMDIPVMADKTELAYREATTWYGHNALSPWVQAVVPTTIVCLFAVALCRLAVRRSFLTLLHVTMLCIVAPYFILVIDPSQKRIADVYEKGVPDKAPASLIEDLELNFVGHAILGVSCIVGAVLLELSFASYCRELQIKQAKKSA